MDDYVKYFIDDFKKINEEQLKVLGLSVFGNNINYLKSEKPKLIEKFKDDYGIKEENYADRLIFKYVVNDVQNYERNKPFRVKKESDGSETIVRLKKPTVREVIDRIKEIRRKNKA